MGLKTKIHVLCVLNPTAGNGFCRQRWPKIASLMESFDIDYEILIIDDDQLAAALFARFKTNDPGKYDVVCGIGGDGTHSQVINALMRFKHEAPAKPLPPYALIPCGTGNDIAKSFGLTTREDFFVDDLRRAVAAIRYGADYYLDLGKMNGLYFVDALTIGLDSHILREHNRQKEEITKYPLLRQVFRGNLLYTWCLGLRFLRHASIEAAIRVDGREWYRGRIVNLVVNNTRVYGGEFVICPDSFANDGLLDVVVFAGHYDYLAKYLLSFRTNPREIRRMAEPLMKESTYIQGRKIEVSLSRKEAAQYDGEVLPSCDKFEVEVVPRAIQIKLPVEFG